MNRKLIILNTVVSYARSALAVGLTLFSSRWVLQALGKEDLGLFYAVGGVVVFLSFVNASMAFSSQRHFAYAIGHGGCEEVKGWFNSSVSLHLMLIAAFLLLALPLGMVAFSCWLKIPDVRFDACVWVYVFSCITAMFAIVNVPFNAMYIATQRIYELTIIQMLQTVLLFALAWWLLTYSGDRLTAYAMGMLVINFAVYAAQILRCFMSFPECRIRRGLMFDKRRYCELLSFSGWSLVSTFAYILRGQGIALLLNNFGSAGCNAALGLSNQVSAQAGFLSNGFMNAIAPEITSMEGRGEREGMNFLATRTCKYVTLLILFVILPLFTDVQPLLELWLRDVPEYTVEFVHIMLVAFLAVHMVLGVTVATKAVGRIALPESVAAVALLFAVPLAYLGLKIGFSVVVCVGMIAVTAVLCAVSTLVCAKKIFGYSVSSWIKEVLCRTAVVAVPCIALNCVLHRFLEEGMLRLIVVSVLDAILITIVGWSLALGSEERRFVKMKFKNIIGKLGWRNTF